MCQNINFIDMNEDETKLVHQWRNNPNIRKWMHKKEYISLSSHKNFILSLKNSTTKIYFLVKKDDKYIGVIDLDRSFLGVYANPKMKRVGDILLKRVIEFAFKKKGLPSLRAEVYKKNITAIKLYERFGFKVFKESVNKLIMELES